MQWHAFDQRYQVTKELSGKHIVLATATSGRQDHMLIETLLNKGAHVHVVASDRGFLASIRSEFIQHAQSFKLRTICVNLNDPTDVALLAQTLSALPLVAVIANFADDSPAGTLPLRDTNNHARLKKNMKAELLLPKITIPILSRSSEAQYLVLDYGEPCCNSKDNGQTAALLILEAEQPKGAKNQLLHEQAPSYDLCSSIARAIGAPTGECDHDAVKVAWSQLSTRKSPADFLRSL